MDNSAERECSSEEFQRKLFDWFEQRGLLSELRAFMRHRMISALYGTDSPAPQSHFTSFSPLSPIVQAILLLVAEFLVQQDYHYTLSVMVAEVPLLASLPKFAHYVSYMSNENSTSLKKKSIFPRYSDDDLKEILEALGFMPDSESSQHIHRLYKNNGARESLLACALTALSAIAQHSSAWILNQNQGPEPRTKKYDEFTKWLEEVRLILLRAQLTSSQLQRVEDLLFQLYSDSTMGVRKEEQEKSNRQMQSREQQLQTELLLREEQFRIRVEEVEDDLRKKQIHLQNVTTQLQQQHDEVLSRLNRVQKHADDVRKQEKDLIEKEKEIGLKQHQLKEEQHAFAQAASTIEQSQSDVDTKTLVELGHLQERCSHLEAELRDTRAQLQSSTLLKIEAGVQATELVLPGAAEPSSPKRLDRTTATHQHEPSPSSSSCSFSIDGSATKSVEKSRDRNTQITLLKRILRRVQQENSELRAHSAQQRRRIDELTTRAAQLAAHIADRGSTVTPHSAPGSPAPQQPTAPPPPPAPPLPVRQTRIGIGAAGDRAQPVSAPRQPHALRTWRRRPPRRLLHHASFSSDDSPTEEVWREARNRLRRLDEESEVVDRSYRDFRARQADNLNSTASLLFVPPAQANALNTDSIRVPTETLTGVSVHFPSPHLSYSSPGTTSVRTAGPGLTGYASSFSPLSRPSFTLPERSVFASPSNRISARAEDVIPHRPSVLRRPSESIRDLLNTQTHLMRSVTIDGTQPQSELKKNEARANICSAAVGSGIGETEVIPSTFDSVIVTAAQDMQSLHLSCARENIDAKPFEIQSASVINNTEDRGNHVPSNLTSLKIPNVDIQTSHQNDDKEKDPLRSVNFIPPLPQRIESLSSQVPSLKTVPTELTVFEDLSPSALTYEPRTRDLDARNSASKIPDPSVTTDASGRIPSSQPSFRSQDIHSKTIHEAGNTALSLITKKSANDEEGQVINVSLSSVEASDQQLSVGLDGKKSDDDDDFW